MNREVEVHARLAAIAFVQGQSQIREDVIPRSILEAGFQFRGRQLTLQGPQGIWFPAGFEVPLSITTIPVAPGKPRPYEDDWTSEDLLIYRYRGTDPRHRDNVGLRDAMRRSVPLIYFHGVAEGRYVAACPVFIVGDSSESLSFTVAIDDPPAMREELAEPDDARRRYVTRLVQQRLHQADFRVRVLKAYRRMCAMCRLRHEELLDAAHILSDADPGGLPSVSNGVALCKLHHAAFDAHIVGIRPDQTLVVREDVLREVDGPMLRYGLQGLAGKKLIVPANVALQPNPLYLEQRYEMFRHAS